MPTSSPLTLSYCEIVDDQNLSMLFVSHATNRLNSLNCEYCVTEWSGVTCDRLQYSSSELLLLVLHCNCMQLRVTLTASVLL